MESLKNAFRIYLSDYFKNDTNVTDIREIPGWFLSKAYILTCSENEKSFELFSRTISSDRGGYVYPIDRYRAFQISDQMYKNAASDIVSHGTMMYQNGKCTFENDGSESIEFFHIQDFRKGSSYFDKYFALAQKSTLEQEDRDTLQKIARKIGKIHSCPIPDMDRIHQSELLVRGYREILINPELTFDVLSQFEASHPMFGHVEHKYEYLANMTREYDRMIRLSPERKLSYLHGDFWASNILLETENGNDPLFIDFSRIPYGDASIDIGWFVGNLTLEHIKTGNRVYLDAANIFMDAYIEATNDRDILRFAVLPLFWLGIISLFPPVFGNKEPLIADKILEYIDACFKKGELIINER